MKKTILFLLFLLFLSANISIHSENIYFSTRTTFANAQFWERQVHKEYSDFSRKIFANYFSGSVGVGMEMIIWDMGKKRGSRLYFKTGFDMLFSGLSFMGGYKEQEPNAQFYKYDDNGKAFYMGFDWDIYVGGTFPKTDLIWGFGSMFVFLFPTYSPNIPVSSFYEKYSFYAVPSILLAYDIFIPNTKFKITPQLKLGFTANPMIPDDLLGVEGTRDMDTVGGNYVRDYLYSGLYIDISVAFSFLSITWKD